MFEKERTDRREATIAAGSPHIRTWLHRQAGRQGRTVIALNDGSAFLSEQRLGSGRMLLYNVSPTLRWSDFPLKGLFAPLIHRSVVYVSPRDEQQTSFITGDAPVIRIRSTAENRGTEGQYTLAYPDGNEEILQPTVTTVSHDGPSPWLTFTLPPLQLPGLYPVKRGTNTLEIVAVNVDGHESDLRPLPPDAAGEAWNRLGFDPAAVRRVSPDERLQASILESRFGLELWKHFVVCALLLALAEMLIARDSRRATQTRMPS